MHICAIEQCILELQKKSKDAFLCCIFTNSSVTKMFAVIYLMHIEVLHGLYTCKDKNTLLTRIIWWKWQVDAIYNSKKCSSELSRNPIIASLSDIIKQTNLPHSTLLSYFNGYEEFLNKISSFSISDLEIFMENTFGIILKILLFISGIHDYKSDIIKHAGIAWGLSVTLRNQGKSSCISFLPSDIYKKESEYCEAEKYEALHMLANIGITHSDIAFAMLKKLPMQYDFTLPNLVISLFHLKRIQKMKPAKRSASCRIKIMALYIKRKIGHKIRITKDSYEA